MLNLLLWKKSYCFTDESGQQPLGEAWLNDQYVVHISKKKARAKSHQIVQTCLNVEVFFVLLNYHTFPFEPLRRRMMPVSDHSFLLDAPSVLGCMSVLCCAVTIF
jgi:hypothetical protein